MSDSHSDLRETKVATPMPTLRPIGTVFTHTFPPARDSTDPHPYRLTYRVKEHVRTEFGMREGVECLRTERLPAPTTIPIPNWHPSPDGSHEVSTGGQG